VSPSGWGAFQQLHSNDIYHAPPIFFIGARDAYYVQLISGDLDYLNDPTKSHAAKYEIGALQKGKWVDFVWKIKFAKTFTGSVDVWRRIEGETDFTQVLSVANMPTLSFKSSVSGGAVLDAYWKTGYYTSAENFTRVIYIDCNTRGADFNDVVAAAFPTSSATSTATATAKPDSTVLGAGIYDDSNSGFTYSGSWLNYSGAGPYNNTLHYTQTVGATASFSFNGTGFKIFYTTASDRGTFEVWVDGVLVATVNANTSTVSWQHKYVSPAFAADTHTVQIRHVGPTGTTVDLGAATVFP
jgi:hypothetical protein